MWGLLRSTEDSPWWVGSGRASEGSGYNTHEDEIWVDRVVAIRSLKALLGTELDHSGKLESHSCLHQKSRRETPGP